MDIPLRRSIAENLHFDTAIQAISTKEEQTATKKEFETASDADSLGFIYKSGEVSILTIGLNSLTWDLDGKLRDAAAVQSEDGMVWAIEADESGREVYTLKCYNKRGVVWHNETSIGPFLCVKNGVCYVVECTSELRYGRCVSLDAKTGGERRLLFTEPSRRNNLSLLRGEGGCVFLQSDNSGTKALYVIDGVSVKRIGEECVSFVPVGYDESSAVCFFGRIGNLSAPWTPFGIQHNIPLAVRRDGIDLFSSRHAILITSSGGVRRIYRCGYDSVPKKLDEIVGQIGYDIYSLWEGKDTVRVVYKEAGKTPSVYDISSKGMKRIKAGVEYAKHTVLTCRSKDGTAVPYILVQKGKARRGLMIVIYGAYGLPTGLGTSRWKPYLDAGWGIVFGLIRGGGDFGDEWAAAARTYKKWKSVEDAIAVILAAQKRTGISWERTCIYGRSAGGYTLGAIVAHHGTGGIVGAAYAEVPYVDVLRTTSTPSLPLTILEYDEFGNPRKNPRDLKTIRELSPVDALPSEGAPGVFVVARTSMNDREVLPYESVKWVDRLRGKSFHGEEKYLAITDGHGHFVSGSTGNEQKAQDFILLDSWLTSRGRV